MLTDVITVNDGVVARAYTLVSRNGMDSTRRETTAGIVSSALSGLTVKHTLDDRNIAKPNRHLVAFTYTEYDTAGKAQTCTAHCVITRAKGSTDAQVKKQIAMLAAFIAVGANQDQLLIGGN
jgi:hypothetical protein